MNYSIIFVLPVFFRIWNSDPGMWLKTMDNSKTWLNNSYIYYKNVPMPSDTFHLSQDNAHLKMHEVSTTNMAYL